MNERFGAKTRRVLIGLSAVSAACGPGAATEQIDGPFTGEVKPVLYVTDVETSAPFFQDVLGFDFLGYSEREGAPYYAEMLAGDLKFGLHEPTSPEHAPRIGQQRIYFRVTDLMSHRATVQGAGAGVGDIVETDWMDFFIVEDMDGHEIVFAVTDPSRHSIDPW